MGSLLPQCGPKLGASLREAPAVGVWQAEPQGRLGTALLPLDVKRVEDCYLYGILDLGYVAPADVKRVTRELIADGAGVDILQIRAKGFPPREIAALAEAVRPVTARFGIPLILNDHPQLVSGTGADGAHIGQDDGPLAESRRDTGAGKLIGRSTHSLAQARAARDEGADYLGFGPLFATPTKPDYAAIGLDDIALVHREVADRPIFCIGGIKLDNLRAVIAAGARRVVIVSGLLQAADISAAAREAKGMLAQPPATASEAAGSIIAETPRLRLRRFTLADTEALAEILGHPEVMRFSTAGPMTREQVGTMLRDRVLAAYTRDGFGLWAVESKAEGRSLLGYCGLLVWDIDGRREIEIGYRLARSAWGQGLATEAARATRDDAIRRLGFRRLISLIDPANTASIRVAEKNGMRLERQIVKWDRPINVYALEVPAVTVPGKNES